MTDEIRPLSDDASADIIKEMFDLDSEDWHYSDEGDYESACVEAMNRQGGNFQTLVALEWPMENRKTKEKKKLRLLISPDDAEGLAKVLLHNVAWLKSRPSYGYGQNKSMKKRT